MEEQPSRSHWTYSELQLLVTDLVLNGPTEGGSPAPTEEQSGTHHFQLQRFQCFCLSRGAAEAAGAGGGAGDVGPAAAAAVLFHFTKGSVRGNT